ncbi:hypothetical protein DFJ74DRAFT_657558 [Hyaloraphidium curvatum]|nr:hypothetical protein DFJ74DRAFT_657558 [Hyaloraphidium curvatum]
MSVSPALESPSLAWQAPSTASRPPLSEEQVAAYLRDGFLIVDGLVPSAELEELKRDFITIAKGGYPSSNIKPLPADSSDSEVLKNVLAIHMPHYVSPVMRRYISHPRIAPILGQLTGAHMAPGWWDGSVKCMQTMLFVKPPGFQGQAWHQDEAYIPTRDRSLTAIWIAIDHATAENGTLRVLPGSHRRGILFPQREHTNVDEYDFAKESYGFDGVAKSDGWGEEVTVDLKPGSVLFFNGYLLHRSTKNRSQDYRRVLTNHYMSGTSNLPWDAVDRTRKQSGAMADVRRVVHTIGPEDPLQRPTEPFLDFCYMRTCKENTPEETHAELLRTGGFPGSYANKTDKRNKL